MPPRSTPSPGAVASGHPLTTEAGLVALRAGGNAFDALVAAALAATVCEPLLTGFGGGGLVTTRTAAGDCRVFEFMSVFPGLDHGLEPREFLAISVDYGPTRQVFHAGRGAVAVPTVALGLQHLHDRLGRLPRTVLAEPAAALAREGAQGTETSAVVARMLAPITALSARSRALFLPGGEAAKPTMSAPAPAVAEAIEAFGRSGAAPFVRGEFAAALLDAFGPPFGSLGPTDLERYAVVERAPITVPFHGSTLFVPPPPCLGGALLAFGMRLLHRLPTALTERDRFAAAAAVMAQTEAARSSWFDRQGMEGGAVERLLSEVSLTQHAAAIASRGHAGAGGVGAAPGAIPGNTTHISVVDAEGNAASYTSSNGESCGWLWPGADLPVNNFLGEEDINPLGFHLGQPGSRLRTMMTPSLLVDDAGGVTALGTGGANRIRTAMLQVVRNLVDSGLSLRAAVLHPRMHVEGDRAAIEGVDLPPDVIEAALAGASSHTIFPDRHLYFGGVHCVRRHADGRFEAVGDPRRSGCGALA